MQVHIVISDSDSIKEKGLARAIMSMVYGSGVSSNDRIAPEDNPAVGGGVPAAPLAQSQQEHSNGSPASGSTGGVTLLTAQGLPAEYVHPATPAGPANVAGGMPEFDSEGLPWDMRIHADTKGKNADGSWRRRRGVTDKTFVGMVENELRAIYGTTGQHMSAEQRQAANQWAVPGVSPETANAVQAGQPITVSPNEAAALAAASQASMQHAATPAVPVAATPAVPTAPAQNTLPPHVMFLQQVGPHIITDANPHGLITSQDVNEQCKMLGIVDPATQFGTISRLSEHPLMIEPLRNLLNAKLAAAAALAQRQAPVLQ